MNLVQKDMRLLVFALLGSVLLHSLVLFALDFRFEETPDREPTVLTVQLVPKSAPVSDVLANPVQELIDNPVALVPDASTSTQEVASQQTSSLNEITSDESLQDSQINVERDTPTDQSVAQESQQQINSALAPEVAVVANPKPQLSVRDLVAAATSIAREQSSEQNVRNIAGNDATNTEEQYYLKAWLKKVQEIGQLNYPQEAVEKNLYGKLRLYVAIKPDGSLEETRVVRSSGHDVLDEAAIHIVELAAPFSAFPKSMRESLDLLEIVREWEFRKEALVPTTDAEED